MAVTLAFDSGHSRGTSPFTSDNDFTTFLDARIKNLTALKEQGDAYLGANTLSIYPVPRPWSVQALHEDDGRPAIQP